MKNNKWNLITSLLYLLASSCFVIAAIAQDETTPKLLYCIASICFLTGGIGFLCIYIKSKKKPRE